MTFLIGNISNSISAQLDTLNLTKALFCEVNPIPVKAGLNIIGYNAGIPRLPLVEMSNNGKEILKAELQKFMEVK